MRFENKLPGGIKFPGDEELLFAGLCRNHGLIRFCRHVISPFSTFLKPRRVDQTYRSNIVQTVQPNRKSI
jgi:hypothetical protein